MFLIFALLFVLLFAAGKVIYEIVVGTSQESVNQQWLIKKASLTNRKFEEALAKKIGDPKYRDEIEELIKDDLQYVYGDAWKELFADRWFAPSHYSCSFSKPEQIVLALMLSRSGLLSDYYRNTRIEISNFPIANVYECLRILHRVEKNIKERKKYTDEKIVFFPQIKYDYPRKRWDKGVPDYKHPCSGSFRWNFEPNYSEADYFLELSHPILVNACKEASSGERSLASNPYKDKLVL